MASRCIKRSPACNAAFYNLDSELILSDTLQATALLCIPEDFLKGDTTLSISAQFALPMKKDQVNGGYTSPAYISPPTDPSDALRRDKEDLRAAADRAAALSKPAGAETPGTVGQSGLSKVMDAQSGQKLLTSISKILAKAETFLGELALVVTYSRDLTPEETLSIQVGYPTKFDIADASQLLLNMGQLQLVAGACGELPMIEQTLLGMAIRQLVPGLDDAEYAVMDDEIELLVTTNSKLKEQAQTLKQAMFTNARKPSAAGGLNEDDPTGQSAGTALGNAISTIGA